LRYGVAVFSVALALATAVALRRHNLPHPFTSISLTAIAITFWFAGAGPGIVALGLSSLAMHHFFIPFFPGGPSQEFYQVVYGLCGLLVGWFSASRRRAERLLTEARNSLEVRVGLLSNFAPLSKPYEPKRRLLPLLWPFVRPIRSAAFFSASPEQINHPPVRY
jgi:hypothetical protein